MNLWMKIGFSIFELRGYDYIDYQEMRAMTDRDQVMFHPDQI
jgi:hypothetical protein